MSTTSRSVGDEGGDGEAAKGVEDARIERDHRHEDEIRERDAGKRTAARTSPDRPEARGEHEHQPRHGDLAEHHEGDEQHGEAREGLAGESARRLRIGVETLGKERDEGRVERALGEQPAEHVGNAEGHEKGIRHRRGAEHGRDQNVQDEAGGRRAARDGHGADSGEAAVELH